jgi:hypothetical protein
MFEKVMFEKGCNKAELEKIILAKKHEKCMQTQSPHHCCCESSPGQNPKTKLCRLLVNNMDALHTKYCGMEM